MENSSKLDGVNRVPSDKLTSSRFEITLIRNKPKSNSREIKTKLLLRNNGQLDFEKYVNGAKEVKKNSDGSINFKFENKKKDIAARIAGDITMDKIFIASKKITQKSKSETPSNIIETTNPAVEDAVAKADKADKVVPAPGTEDDVDGTPLANGDDSTSTTSSDEDEDEDVEIQHNLMINVLN